MICTPSKPRLDICEGFFFIIIICPINSGQTILNSIAEHKKKKTQSSIFVSTCCHFNKWVCALMYNTTLCAHVRACLCVLPLVVCSVKPGHRMLQGHVLRSGERQPACAVVMDQLWDAAEHTAALVQGEDQALCTLGLGHDDVHAVLTGSDRGQTHCRISLVGLCVGGFLFSSVSQDNVNHSWVHFGFSTKVNGGNLVCSGINELLTHTHTHCGKGRGNLFFARLSVASLPHVAHIIVH